MHSVFRSVVKLRCQSWLFSVLLFGLCGCSNFIDTITARDFHLKDLWAKPPEPLAVLRDSTDGAKRGKALASMKEPLAHGGTQEQQELYIRILVEKATRNPPMRDRNNPLAPYPEDTDPDSLSPLVRLGAIYALGGYKDPRAAVALKEIYQGIDPRRLQPGSKQGPLPFHPDVNNKIRMHALGALERTGSTTARETFIEVAKGLNPGRNSAAADQDLTIGERLAALRGLARFHDPEVLNLLVGVLETRDENIAVRQRAHQSLKEITGKNYSEQNLVAWHSLIQNSPPEAFAHQPGPVQRLMNIFGN